MDGTNLIHKTNKFKIGILVATIISYACFILSHFLVWGYHHYVYSFTGLDSLSGIFSMAGFNSWFLIGFYNYADFYFRKQMKKDYLEHWITNIICIIACTVTFILALIMVFIGWGSLCFSVDRLVFGFYVWLVSVIVIIGVLVYLNVIFLKIHELKNLYVEANITSPFTSSEVGQ